MMMGYWLCCSEEIGVGLVAVNDVPVCHEIFVEAVQLGEGGSAVSPKMDLVPFETDRREHNIE